MSTARAYRRNYRMMELAKLARSISELEHMDGEAYDKVVDNDGDLDSELARARAALDEKQSQA